MTTMAYYEDGLTQNELKEALKILLEMGESARNWGYNRWLRIGSVDDPSVDSVTKLDLKNAVQFEVLYRTFRLNMACIEFWLKNCVFCRDAKVYETSIMASTWFLDSGSALGFSGTNDCSKMLPLHISERRNPDCRLHGVNGEMIEKMINVCTLKQFLGKSSAVFCEEFVEWCVVTGFDAIIDRGAYFAGWSNEMVCIELVRFIGHYGSLSSKPQKRGVVYYENGDWVLVCVQTLLRTSLGAANVHVHDTIVYFDQCRCRGVDIVLARNARAVLTMGPDTRKAEFMQAAGRMRGLDFGACEDVICFFNPSQPAGQTIVVVVNDAVEKAISRVVPDKYSGILRILAFVFMNTVEWQEMGLEQWYRQGVHRQQCKKHANGQTQLLDASDLEQMYSKALRHRPITEEFSKTVKSAGVTMNDPVIARIHELLLEYGSTRALHMKSLDQECERELEIVTETLETVKPIDSFCIAAPDIAYDLTDSPKLLSLAKWAKLYCPDIAGIEWSDSIVGSPRFWVPVLQYCEEKAPTEKESCVEMFLQSDAVLQWVQKKYPNHKFPPNWCLRVQNSRTHMPVVQMIAIHPDGQVVLLSENEAEKLIATNTKGLHHMSKFAASKELQNSLPASVSCQLLLFSGCTEFQNLETELLLLLLSFKAKTSIAAAKNVITFRGLQHKWDESQVQQACEKVAQWKQLKVCKLTSLV
jgi:hypothetical protein